jgi:hypothetical protein
MKYRFFPRKKLEADEEIRLETLLASAFIPVKPRISFSDSLKDRLTREPIVDLEQAPSSITKYLLLATTLILTGLVLAVAGIRIAIALLGFLGLAQRVKSNIDEHSQIDTLQVI